MPDGQEYFAGAVSIVRYGKFGLRIGDDFLPSRYPPGYSLFIVPFIYFMSQTKTIAAPYIVNQLIGGIIIIGIFLFYFFQSRFIAAGVSVLLLVTLPSFIIFSRSSLSENLAVLVVLLVFLFVYLSTRTNHFQYMVLAGFILGLGLSIRLQLVLLVPVLGTALFIRNKKPLTTSSRLFQLFLTFLAFIIGFLPLAIYNLHTFGSFLETGYDFWVPEQTLFKFDYILKNLRSLWKDISLSQTEYKVARIFGPGVYFTVPFLVLGLVSVIDRFFKVDRVSKYIICAVIFYFLATLSYSFSDDARFFYPIFVLLIFPIADFFERFFLVRLNNRKNDNLSVMHKPSHYPC